MLNRQPATPVSEPAAGKLNLASVGSPIDLQTGAKYAPGEKVVLQGLEYGQWYYVYLNKKTDRIGWLFPTMANTLEFVLPPGVGNGRDDVVVLDAAGAVVAFDRLQVTPKG